MFCNTLPGCFRGFTVSKRIFCLGVMEFHMGVVGEAKEKRFTDADEH